MKNRKDDPVSRALAHALMEEGRGVNRGVMVERNPPKVNLVHESDRTEPCQISQYLHCGQCLKEIPEAQSPETWARLTVGITRKGIQIWCVRHKCSVDHIKFTTEPVVGVKLTNDCGHEED